MSDRSRIKVAAIVTALFLATISAVGFATRTDSRPRQPATAPTRAAVVQPAAAPVQRAVLRGEDEGDGGEGSGEDD